MSEVNQQHVQIIKNIAKMAHEQNRMYCALFMDDFSIPAWKNAPEHMKISTINGIHAIIENIQLTPEESHKNWMTHKEQNGWVYGEVKDEEAKTHPCMVPYAELPEDQKAKDALFTNLVKTLVISNLM